MKFARYRHRLHKIDRKATLIDGKLYDLYGSYFEDFCLNKQNFHTPEQILFLPPITPNKIVYILNNNTYINHNRSLAGFNHKIEAPFSFYIGLALVINDRLNMGRFKELKDEIFGYFPVISTTDIISDNSTVCAKYIETSYKKPLDKICIETGDTSIEFSNIEKTIIDINSKISLDRGDIIILYENNIFKDSPRAKIQDNEVVVTT